MLVGLNNFKKKNTLKEFKSISFDLPVTLVTVLTVRTVMTEVRVGILVADGDPMSLELLLTISNNLSIQIFLTITDKNLKPGH